MRDIITYISVNALRHRTFKTILEKFDRPERSVLFHIPIFTKFFRIKEFIQKYKLFLVHLKINQLYYFKNLKTFNQENGIITNNISVDEFIGALGMFINYLKVVLLIFIKLIL